MDSRLKDLLAGALGFILGWVIGAAAAYKMLGGRQQTMEHTIGVQYELIRQFEDELERVRKAPKEEPE